MFMTAEKYQSTSKCVYTHTPNTHGHVNVAPMSEIERNLAQLFPTVEQNKAGNLRKRANLQHETLTQPRLNVGPPSATLAKH